MAPRRTLCTHITSISTNSSTSGGARAAAGSTHVRGRAHTVRGYLLNTNPPTRAIEDQAAAWLLALRYGWSVFVDRSTCDAFVGTITDMGLCDAAMQGLSAERREQVASVERERRRCASMQGVVEGVGRDAEVQRVSHAAADPFSARGNARATPQSLEAMAGVELLRLKAQLYGAQRRASEAEQEVERLVEVLEHRDRRVASLERENAELEAEVKKWHRHSLGGFWLLLSTEGMIEEREQKIRYKQQKIDALKAQLKEVRAENSGLGEAVKMAAGTEDMTGDGARQRSRGTRRRGSRWKAGSKFGTARDLGVFRSHDRSLQGEYYRNRRGQRYYGSVCDSCERDGKSHFHHPLRCFVQHPGWWQAGNAPEDKGVKTWYVRGGGTASISSSRRGCRGMEGDEQVCAGDGGELQTEAAMGAEEEGEKENGDEETIDDGEQIEEEEVVEDAEEMAEQM